MPQRRGERRWIARRGLRIGVLLIGLFAVLPAGTAVASELSPYVTDGPVRAITRAGGNTYIGGDFSNVGVRSGPGVLVDAGSGATHAFPEIAGGEVDSVIGDGSGGWYIGGSFTSVGGEPQAGLAHIEDDGTLDTAFHPNVVGSVYALALASTGADAGTLYLGGDFSRVGGFHRSDVAAVDKDSGEVYDDWIADADAPVRALAHAEVLVAPSSGRTMVPVVVAGGDFSKIGAQPGGFAAPHLAALWGRAAPAGACGSDPCSGMAAGWTPSPAGSVLTLAVAPAQCVKSNNSPVSCTDPTAATFRINVFAGGTFPAHLQPYQIQNTLSINSISSQTPSSWSTTNAPDGIVRSVALSADGNVVYAGGEFTHAGSSPTSPVRNHLAAYATSGAPFTAWHPDPDGLVDALKVAPDGSVFAGGEFGQVAGAQREYGAHVAGVTSLTVSDPSNVATLADWDPHLAGYLNVSPITIDRGVRALAVSPDQAAVYAGGAFTATGAEAHAGLAAFGPDGSLLHDWSTGVSCTPGNPGDSCTRYVHALIPIGGSLYAGGQFDHAGDVAVSNLAKIDPGSGAVDPAFTPNPDAAVLALAPGEGNLYLGGAFESVGGSPRGLLAEVDTATGVPLAWAPTVDESQSPPARVYSLNASCANVYVGGHFDSVGGQPRANVAALDPANGDPTGWAPNANGSVHAVGRFDGTVYLGGAFGFVGGQPRSRLAGVDVDSGHTTSWNPGADGSVRALTVSENTVYAGGSFGAVGGEPHTGVAAIDRSSGSVGSFDAQPDGPVNALSLGDQALAIGGSFTSLAGLTQQGFGALPVDDAPPAAVPCAKPAPAAPPPPPSPPPPDNPPSTPRVDTPRPPAVADVLSLRISPAAFYVSRAPTAVAARRRRGHPLGTSISYRLSDPGTVHFNISRAVRGWRVGRTCHVGRRPRHSHGLCTTYVFAGSLVRSAPAGTGKLFFSGRIGGRALKPGSYRVTVTAFNQAGAAGKSRSARFRVLELPAAS